MNIKELKDILKFGECFDTYKIGNKKYYSIQYKNKLYLISEYRNIFKIEKRGF